jgi:hypothetical protein
MIIKNIELFKGYKVKKIEKATKKGTRIIFEKLEDDKFDFEMKKIRNYLGVDHVNKIDK